MVIEKTLYRPYNDHAYQCAKPNAIYHLLYSSQIYAALSIICMHISFLEIAYNIVLLYLSGDERNIRRVYVAGRDVTITIPKS